MKNKRKIGLSILATFCIVLSCSKETPYERANNHFTIDTAKAEVIKQTKTLEDIFEKQSLIELETNNRCKIGRIDEFIEVKSKNRIIVLDYKNSEVFLFDTDGKFINQIGKKGKGPGEFIRLFSACYDNDKIYIGTNYTLLVYDIKTGDYLTYYSLIKNEDIIYVHKIYVKDDILVTYQRYPSSKKNDVIVYSLSKEKIINVYGHGETNYGYQVNLFTQLNNTYFIYGNSFNKDLYQIDLDNKTIKVFSTLDDVTILPDKFKNIKDQNQQVMWKQKNRDISNNFKPLYNIQTVQGFIFVEQIITSKGGKYYIYDSNGNLLNILNDYDFLSSYKNLMFRDEPNYKFTSEGLIIYGYEKEKPISANPTLVYYKLKDKLD
ncbi:MAG: 6-bladed beta-propeller [Ignavibacteriales bacterium]|nr:6-bladed beta-propeller [Ignavibacteriales bacterium]